MRALPARVRVEGVRTRQLVALAVALAVVGLLVGSFTAVAGSGPGPTSTPADPCIRVC